MEELSINHNIVKFLRVKFGFSVEDVVTYAKIPDIKAKKGTDEIKAAKYLLAVEEGTQKPTKNIVMSLANLYKVPFLTFFLDKEPVFCDQLIDFRTFDSKTPVKDSPVLFAVKRKISLLQKQLAEIEKTQSNAKKDFVRSVPADLPIEHFVERVRAVLDFSVDQQKNLRKTDDLFRIIRRKIESIGIFVIQLGNLGSYHTNLSTNEFRGIAISDDYAPLIVINPNDTYAAQLFSLLHELAHVFLGDTSISNVGLSSYRVDGKERICNAFAAEFLLPAKDMEGMPVLKNSADVMSCASSLAVNYHVSNMVVIRRLYDAKKISQKLFNEANAIISSNFKKSKNTGTPSKNVIDRAHLGERTVRAINFATEVNLMTPMTAATVLGINVGRLYKVIA